MKFKIDRYYKDTNRTKASNWPKVFKCIDKEDSVYFFGVVDGEKYSMSRCNNYDKFSKLCKKCTDKTICSETLYGVAKLIEVPYLKAILLYEKV